MSWEGEPHFRWSKMYRGVRYRIRCGDLKTPPPWTKDSTASAANLWWKAKNCEIDALHCPTPHLDPTSRLLRGTLETTPLDDLREIADRGRAAADLIDLLDHAACDGDVERTADGVFIGRMDATEELVGRLLDGQPVPLDGLDRGLRGRPLEEARRVELVGRLTARLAPDVVKDHDRTIRGQIEAWLRLKEAAVGAGEIDPGRYGAYKATAAIFRNWIGGEKEVTAITPAKLEEFHAWLLTQVSTRKQWMRAGDRRQTHGAPGYSTDYAASILHTTKMLVARLADHGLVSCPPSVFRKLKISKKRGNIQTFTVTEVRALLTGCDGHAERTKLYLLLCVNCGFYQSDISDLVDSELDWQAGTITRSRSKTPDGPVVTFPLWPETLDLLKRHRNTNQSLKTDDGGVRVLVTAKGGPLVPSTLENGKHRKTDTIQSAYRRLVARLEVPRKALKLLRKTSASLLEKHDVYGRYAQYFLGQSPRTQAENHYVVPSKEKFFAAVAWLREQYLTEP